MAKVYTHEEIARMMAHEEAWRKKTYRVMGFLFGREKDAELIKWLEQQPNITEYIKQLVRDDIAESGIGKAGS